MYITGSLFGISMTSSGLMMKLAEWKKIKAGDASAGKTRISEEILSWSSRQIKKWIVLLRIQILRQIAWKSPL